MFNTITTEWRISGIQLVLHFVVKRIKSLQYSFYWIVLGFYSRQSLATVVFIYNTPFINYWTLIRLIRSSCSLTASMWWAVRWTRRSGCGMWRLETVFTRSQVISLSPAAWSSKIISWSPETQTPPSRSGTSRPASAYRHCKVSRKSLTDCNSKE